VVATQLAPAWTEKRVLWYQLCNQKTLPTFRLNALLPWWRLKHSVEISARFSNLKVGIRELSSSRWQKPGTTHHISFSPPPSSSCWTQTSSSPGPVWIAPRASTCPCYADLQEDRGMVTHEKDHAIWSNLIKYNIPIINWKTLSPI